MLETKHLRLLILLTGLAILLIILATLLIANSRNQISLKPPPLDSSGIESEQDLSDAEWYIKFSVENQQATAYVGESYRPIAASGEVCFIGGLAMHPLYPLNKGGNPLEPVIPFGTTLYLEEPILVQGQEYKSFQVMDTGDVYYGLWRDSPYWLDIYFGTANYYNRQDAKAFGTQRVNYYWIEKWR